MVQISFGTVAAVMAIAVAAPLLVDLKPSLRIPSAIAEIMLGVAVGPSGLGLIDVDVALAHLSVLGLALLLFLAGLEIDPASVRRGLGTLVVGYVMSVALAVAVALVVDRAENISSPLYIAFALASSTVGLVVAILRDAGETETRFGQAALAGTSVAEFGAIVLISLFFSGRASSTGAQVVLLALFAVLVVVLAVGLAGLARASRVYLRVGRLERTSAQLGVRVAMAILIGFAALAGAFGLETILGVFVAGLVLRIADPEERLIHSEFRVKIEAIGYGFLIPIFFVTTGLQLDFRNLFTNPRHLALVPVFLVGLMIARGVPAVLYRATLGGRRAVALGLFQAASLTVMVIAANLGHQLGVFDDPTAAALVVAGVLSVVIFPVAGLRLLGPPDPTAGGEPPAPELEPHEAGRAAMAGGSWFADPTARP